MPRSCAVCSIERFAVNAEVCQHRQRSLVSIPSVAEVSETASEQRGDRAVAVLLGSPTSSAPTYFGPWGRGKLPAWLLKLTGRRIYGETPGAYRGTSLRL
jgi:hypothetical protein